MTEIDDLVNWITMESIQLGTKIFTLMQIEEFWDRKGFFRDKNRIGQIPFLFELFGSVQRMNGFGSVKFWLMFDFM